MQHLLYWFRKEHNGMGMHTEGRGPTWGSTGGACSGPGIGHDKFDNPSDNLTVMRRRDRGKEL